MTSSSEFSPLDSSLSPERGAAHERARVLLVEDDQRVREWLADVLVGLGYEVDDVPSLELARARVRARPYDVVLSDLMLGNGTGLDLLEEIREAELACEVIIMTGHVGVDTAVAAIRKGAYNYVTKPLSVDRIEVEVRRALEKKRLQDALHRASESKSGRFGRMIGASDAMQAVFALLDRCASCDSNVLLLGESGTGKEVAARAIHEKSARSSRPFVPVNLGALPAEIMESELFGHLRGAFTGAHQRRRGLFGAAEGGTIFLDELATAPERVQVSLLRVLQERVIRPVGGESSEAIDVRVIAATNADLDNEIESGRFRQDLYFRLATIVVRLPPLRERRGDIPLLIGPMLERIAQTAGRRLTLAPKALEWLIEQEWPGNVRQLDHALEQASLLSRQDVISVADFKGPDAADDSRVETLEEVERAHIARVMELAGGNKQKAARMLGIPRGNLYRRLERYGLEAAPRPKVPKSKPTAPEPPPFRPESPRA